jgi:hypothetical protein
MGAIEDKLAAMGLSLPPPRKKSMAYGSGSSKGQRFESDVGRHPSLGAVGQHVTPAAHRRISRRACRRAGVPMHTPFTRCMAAPHASRTLVAISPGG